MFDGFLKFLRPWQPYILSALRIVIGLLMLEHGLTKFFHFPYVEQFAGPMEMFSLVWFSALIELVGGVLLTLGLFTRLTAFIMSGEMAFAYFLVHAPQNFYPILNGGELAIVYCFTLLYIAAAGGGAISADNQLGKVS
ncbi:MAG: DoxX family protein [Pseudomonadota bacterium]